MRGKPLWRPSPAAVADANMTGFMRLVHSRHCANMGDYEALHRWSIDHLEDFWSTLWDFAGIVAETRGETVLADGDRIEIFAIESCRQREHRIVEADVL